MHTLLSLCSNLYHLAARHFTAAMPSLASWTGSLCWEHLFLQAPSPMLPSSFRSSVNIPSSQETSLEVSMLDYWAETYDKSRFSIYPSSLELGKRVMWLFLANDWRVEKAGGNFMSCISFLSDSPYPFSSGVKSNIPNGTASISLSLWWPAACRNLCWIQCTVEKNIFVVLSFGAYFVTVGFPGSSVGKESTCNAGDRVLFLGQEDPLEKG